MTKSEIVTLMEFSTQGEAEIYKALLDSAGITSVVQNDLLGMIPLTGPIPDIKLVVSASDEERAREVLGAGFDREEFQAETKTGPRRKKAGSWRLESPRQRLVHRKNPAAEKPGVSKRPLGVSLSKAFKI